MKGAVAEGFSGGKNAVDIRNRIFTIHGVQVMIDRDLARLYQVEAKQFNRQVQRNIERFPPDFMFRLSKGEAQDLRCQIGTSSWGGDRRQYKNLTVTHTDSFHDRFILVDGAELHNLGSSINCLGRRVTSYSTRDKKEVKKLLALVPK